MLEYFTQLSVLIVSSVPVLMYLAKVTTADGLRDWLKQYHMTIIQTIVIYIVIAGLAVMTEYDVYSAYSRTFSFPYVETGGTVLVGALISLGMLKR